jgi:uncharacterized small protein (TIGR04563 family)
MAAKQKLTVYVPDDVFNEMKNEADRQDRTVSWLVEHCWRIARKQVQSYPSVAGLYNEESA